MKTIENKGPYDHEDDSRKYLAPPTVYCSGFPNSPKPPIVSHCLHTCVPVLDGAPAFPKSCHTIVSQCLRRCARRPQSFSPLTPSLSVFLFLCVAGASPKSVGLGGSYIVLSHYLRRFLKALLESTPCVGPMVMYF